MSKRVDPNTARQIFLDAGLEPLEDFPGTRQGWRAQCRVCMSEVRPHLHSVKKGTGCSECAKRASSQRQREKGMATAVAVLSEADLSLIGPYYNARKPIRVKCTLCSREFTTTQSSVKSGAVKCACKKGPRNPLAECHPDLYRQLHLTKNIGLDTAKVGTGTRQRLWWQCSEGHEFQSSPAARIAGNSACPVCSGAKIVSGVNDLETLDPELFRELVTNSRESAGPIHPFSNKKYLWLCKKNPKHVFEASVYSRKSGRACPYCAGKKVMVGDNDLSTTHPQLSLEWHAKNLFSAEEFYAGSHKRAWWLCSRDSSHEWEAIISSRAKGHGCPICAHQKLKVGFNDLETLHPEVARLWHPTLNEQLRPSEILGAPNRSYWWKCPKNSAHSWKAPANRLVSQGDGCAVCANRQIMVGENDLARVNPSIASEWAHELNELGPSDVTVNSHARVWWRCKKYRDHTWQATPGHRARGQGCPICAGRYVHEGFNDLQSQRPDIARQWDEELNGELRPSSILVGSHMKAYWRCSRDPRHSWAASVSSRVRGNGCPICSNQLTVSGINDLATKYPNLISQWDSKKNTNLDPTKLSPGSTKKVWWRCPNFDDHHWVASISSRTRIGSACPICANLQVKPGFNDLATKRPDVSGTWHPTKNLDVTPKQVVPGTNSLFWWQCPSVQDHIWRASVKNRCKGKGCPDCTPAGYTASKTGHLYALKHPVLSAKKIGITNSPRGEGRLLSFERNGWLILKVWSSDNGIVAQAAETRLLRWIRQERSLPPFLSKSEMPRTGGWSETFSDEGLSDRELIEACASVFDEELARATDSD